MVLTSPRTAAHFQRPWASRKGRRPDGRHPSASALMGELVPALHALPSGPDTSTTTLPADPNLNDIVFARRRSERYRQAIVRVNGYPVTAWCDDPRLTLAITPLSPTSCGNRP